jgi:hypothetical protein
MLACGNAKGERKRKLALSEASRRVYAAKRAIRRNVSTTDNTRGTTSVDLVSIPNQETSRWTLENPVNPVNSDLPSASPADRLPHGVADA